MTAGADTPAAGQSGLVTGALLSSDIVDSTRLIASLGDQRSSEAFARHDAIARELITRFNGRELNRTDGFLVFFPRTLDAVAYAIEYVRSLKRLAGETGVPLFVRVGIHFGEVFLRHVDASAEAVGARPIQPEGLAVPVTARINSLGAAGQVLLTRTAFDLARRAVVGHDLFGGELSWLSHGLYQFKGVEEPLEVYEVGIRGEFPLTPPPSSDKALRAVGPGEEETLGWRPAAGQVVPHRENWTLEEKVGEGGFGEVWLARNAKTRLARVFKFCFQADRLRGLKREVSIFTLLREALGDRSDIAHILDYQFDEAPYFIETEYTKEGSLVTWIERRGGLEMIALSARLEIVAQVADALGAAHSAGILHKDVKPSNILVLTDVTMPPKVALADFGIGIVVDRALLAAAGVTDGVMPASTLTYNESSRTGTRIFMAPELLEGRFPSTRSDIYSLGVLLYQMVTGQFGRALASDWRDEIEDPLLREDIGACVAGRPTDRLTSALELADRLRHLPERRRARVRGRLTRFAASFSVVAVLLLAGGVAAYRHESTLRRRAEVARNEAVAARGEAEQAQGRAEAAAVAEAEARRAAVASGLKEHAARGTADRLISFMLFKMREKLRPLNRLDLLEEIAVEALAYYDSIPPELAETTASLRQRTAALDHIAFVLHSQGKISEANEVYRRVHAIRSDLVTREPGDLLLRADLALCHVKLAEMQQALGNLPEALGQFQAAVQMWTRILELDPLHQSALRLALICRERVAQILSSLGRTEESLQAYEAALSEFERASAGKVATSKEVLGLCRINRLLAFSYRSRARYGEALAAATRALDPLMPLPEGEEENAVLLVDLAAGLRDRATILGDVGRIEEAMADARRSLEIGAALVEGDPANWRYRFDLVEGRLRAARVTWSAGTTQAALDLLAEIEVELRTAEAEGDGETPELVGKLTGTSALRAEFSAQGLRDAEGTRRATEAMEAAIVRFKAVAPEDAIIREYEDNVILMRGWAAKLEGKTEEAQTRFEEAIAAYREQHERDPGNGDHVEGLAMSLMLAGRVEEARPLAQRLVDSGYRDPIFLDLCRECGLTLERTEVPPVEAATTTAP